MSDCFFDEIIRVVLTSLWAHKTKCKREQVFRVEATSFPGAIICYYSKTNYKSIRGHTCMKYSLSFSSFLVLCRSWERHPVRSSTLPLGAVRLSVTPALIWLLSDPCRDAAAGTRELSDCKFTAVAANLIGCLCMTGV